jgi:hypothetical protein
MSAEEVTEELADTIEHLMLEVDYWRQFAVDVLRLAQVRKPHGANVPKYQEYETPQAEIEAWQKVTCSDSPEALSFSMARLNLDEFMAQHAEVLSKSLLRNIELAKQLGNLQQELSLAQDAGNLGTEMLVERDILRSIAGKVRRIIVNDDEVMSLLNLEERKYVKGLKDES